MSNVHQTNAGSRMVRIKNCTNPLLPWYRPHVTKVFPVRPITFNDGISIPKNTSVNKVWKVANGPYYGQLLMKVDVEQVQKRQ